MTLVNNHREKGENYAHSLGAYASLVSNEMLAAANIPLDVYHVPVTNHSHEAMIEQQYHMNLEDLRFALYYLPSLRELSRWQYDFNLRRVGIPGSENSLPKAYSPTSNNGFIYLYYDQVQVMLDWYQGFLQISTLDVKNSRGFPHLSVDHWVEVARMLEGYLTPITSITHLEANPLLWMLGNTYQLYEHHVLTLYDLCPTFDQGRALFEEAPKPFGIGLGETSWFSCESLHVRADQKNESNNSRSALVLHWPLFVEAVEWQLLEKLILQEADSPFEHLIIIGACSSAPLSISFGTSSVKVEYFQVHSLCDVEPVDRGVVLYRLKAKLQNLVRSVYHRKTMARRLSPSLFERWLATY